jgi:hypothetical protein
MLFSLQAFLDVSHDRAVVPQRVRRGNDNIIARSGMN